MQAFDARHGLPKSWPSFVNSYYQSHSNTELCAVIIANEN